MKSCSCGTDITKKDSVKVSLFISLAGESPVILLCNKCGGEIKAPKKLPTWIQKEVDEYWANFDPETA